MDGGEVVTCCIEDTLHREWLMDWVVRVYLLKAFGNDILDAGMEPSKESGIEVIYGDAV